MVKEKVCGISSSTPLFVVDLNKEKNEIVLGEEKDLYKKELITKKFNFQVDFEKIIKMENLTAKIRYGAKPANAKIKKIENNIYIIIFEEPQRAITRGQSIVLYNNNVLLGGGIIA